MYCGEGKLRDGTPRASSNTTSPASKVKQVKPLHGNEHAPAVGNTVTSPLGSVLADQSVNNNVPSKGQDDLTADTKKVTLLSKNKGKKGKTKEKQEGTNKIAKTKKNSKQEGKGQPNEPNKKKDIRGSSTSSVDDPVPAQSVVTNKNSENPKPKRSWSSWFQSSKDQPQEENGKKIMV